MYVYTYIYIHIYIYIYIYMYIIYESVCVCVRASTNISLYQRIINLNNDFLTVNQKTLYLFALHVLSVCLTKIK